MDTDRLAQNWRSVQERIAAAACRAGRDPREVKLVAVTKATTAQVARRLIDCGATDLGENYPQELWRKAEALRDLSVGWHLIGHLQSNKAKRTLPLVRMIHGVDSWRLLHVLDELAAGVPNPPSVCLQVNTSGEPSKHGWGPADLLAEAGRIAEFQRIPIVGLMTMAALGGRPEDARPSFAQLRNLRDQVRDRTGRPLTELSMGMTHDFEVAIEEGSTLVRIGTALFDGVAP